MGTWSRNWDSFWNNKRIEYSWFVDLDVHDLWIQHTYICIHENITGNPVNVPGRCGLGSTSSVFFGSHGCFSYSQLTTVSSHQLKRYFEGPSSLFDEPWCSREGKLIINHTLSTPDPHKSVKGKKLNKILKNIQRNNRNGFDFYNNSTIYPFGHAEIIMFFIS